MLTCNLEILYYMDNALYCDPHIENGWIFLDSVYYVQCVTDWKAEDGEVFCVIFS